MVPSPAASTSKASKGRKIGIAVADGLTALLGLAKESTDGVPFVKGVLGGMVWIIDTCRQFQSNREDWEDLAVYISDLHQELNDALRTIDQEPPSELLVDVRKLQQPLVTIASELREMRDRSKFVRLTQTREDPKKIARFHQIIAKAVNKFTAVRLAAIEHKLGALTINPNVSSTDSNTPSTWFGIPALRSSRFVARPSLSSHIEAVLDPADKEDGVTPIAVLIGMGGLGKTQMAIEHCRRMKASGDIKAIFWIDSSSRDALLRGLETVAKKLSNNLPFEDLTSAVAFVVSYLSDWSEKWLIVYDNMDDLSQLADAPVFFPRSRQGSILITSRHRGTAELGTSILIDRMEESEGLRLLLPSVPTNPEERGAACAVLEKLGHLPLAIDQARAYISSRHLKLTEFICEYDSRKAEILKSTPQISVYRRKLSDADKEKSLSVFTTWELSLRQLAKISEHAEQLEQVLTQLAFFHHAEISEPLLAVYAAEAGSNSPMSHFVSKVWAHDRFETEITMLETLCLLHYARNTKGELSLTLHPLVVEWLLLRLPPEKHDGFVLNAFKHLSYCIHSLKTIDFSERRPLLLHCDAILKHPTGPVTIDLAVSYHYLGDLYRQSALFEQAEVMFQRALDGYEKTLDPSHRSIFSAKASLGDVYWDRGHLERAEELYRKAFDGIGGVLEPLDESASMAADNLGVLYHNQDHPAKALKMHYIAFRGFFHTLGPFHPSTFMSIHNIGMAYRDLGLLGVAEEMHQLALKGVEETLGSSHPSTLHALHNLGLVCLMQGQWEKADEMIRQSLEGYEKTFGPFHPSTLRAVCNVGEIYRIRGYVEKAEEMFRRALDGFEKSLGASHPSTLRVMSQLCSMYEQQELSEKAEEMYRRRNLM